MPARVETVVLFLPDVWSCTPTRLEWQDTVAMFQLELEKKLALSTADDDAGHAESKALNALLLTCCRKLQCVVVAVLSSSQQIMYSNGEKCAFFLFKHLHIFLCLCAYDFNQLHLHVYQKIHMLYVHFELFIDDRDCHCVILWRKFCY